MKEYHLHPDNMLFIRENGSNILELTRAEAEAVVGAIVLPQGCTEVLIGVDGVVYATINKAQEGLSHNPLSEVVAQEAALMAAYAAKLAQAAAEPELQ